MIVAANSPRGSTLQCDKWMYRNGKVGLCRHAELDYVSKTTCAELDLSLSTSLASCQRFVTLSYPTKIRQVFCRIALYASVCETASRPPYSELATASVKLVFG